MLSASELVNLQRQLTIFEYNHWWNEVLFTPQWFLLVFTVIVPWYIWLKLVDRKRIMEISLFGTLSIILISLLDVIGVGLGLWGYKYKTCPLIPLLIPVDFTALPIIYMFIYQHYRTWKSFIIVLTIVSFILTFIGEPLVELINIYQRYAWEYIYSLPIYIAIAVFCRLTVTMLIKLNSQQ